MQVIKYSLIAILLAASSPLVAQDAHIILGIEVGRSSLDLDRELEINIDPEALDDRGLSATYSAAYEWENNFLVEGSLAFSGNGLFTLGLADFYKTSEARLMVGYGIELSEHVRLVPAIGLSRWKAELQESAFFNPGPEDEANIDGTDLTYKISLEFPVSKGFMVSLSHGETKIDVGSLNMTQLGLKYAF